jgi:hypothetical protein
MMDRLTPREGAFIEALGVWQVMRDETGQWCIERTRGWSCSICLTRSDAHPEDDRAVYERARIKARALNRIYARD